MTAPDLEKDGIEFAQPSMATQLNDRLIEFAASMGAAVDICSWGLTVGDSYVPFNPDPDDDCDEDMLADGVACSQVWVRVMNMTPLSVNTFGGDCAVEWRIGLEVGVLRCFGIEEDGEAPDASDVLVAATGAMEDMGAIMEAALDTEIWDKVELGEWGPVGPLGGQYGGIWTFVAYV